MPSPLVGLEVPWARQVSGLDFEGKPILAVLAKFTFRIVGGRCVPASVSEQRRVVEKPAADPLGAMTADTDLFPMKPRTDVVVHAHAYSAGRAAFAASIAVGAHVKRIDVHGDRRAELGRDGQVRFTPSAIVERVPLQYARAYGGADVGAARRAFETARAHVPVARHVSFDDFFAGSPFRYPRNPCGLGYVIDRESVPVEGLPLPNLEDPLHPLRPESLLVRHATWWAGMPLPQAAGWMDYAWFPRAAYFGAFSPFDAAIPFAEIARGLVPQALLHARDLTPEDSFRLTCGASLGLQLPYLSGAEEIELRSLDPSQERVSFRLPGTAPRLWVDGRSGRFVEARPVLHTLEVAPEEGLVTLLWSGSAPSRRQYGETELAKMPFRIETA